MHFICPLSPPNVMTGVESTEPVPVVKMLMYILAMTPTSEASKPALRHVVKCAMLQLKSDEPWSTLQAQLLVKISALLKPRMLDYKQYQVYFYIPHSIPKPGMILSNEGDYDILLQHVLALKKLDPTINIDITEQARNEDEKENDEPEVEENS